MNPASLSSVKDTGTKMSFGVQINGREYEAFQRLMFESTGIHLPDNKMPLIMSRLAKRLRDHRLDSYGQYLDLIKDKDNSGELQIAIDLLTTNETYFFREPKHFEFLSEHLKTQTFGNTPFRVWSAACSYGQEAYSIGMLLSDKLPRRQWEIIATDISTRVLTTARRGLYSIDEAVSIPQDYLSRYCLRGTGEHEGTLLINKPIREKTTFMHANLNATLPVLGQFDVIFLRNVMIYFAFDTKKVLLQRLYQRIKPGGYLIVGHSESINGMNPGLKMVSPSVYLKGNEQ